MSIDMSTSTSSVRLEVYDRLKKAFNHLSSMLDAHLTDEILHTLAVDHVQVDLENETERGGPYFLPMSQECMDSLNKRPEFAITFDEEWSSSVWGYDDADTVHMAYRNQLYDSNDESVWHAWQGSHWQPRLYVGPTSVVLHIDLTSSCCSHKSRYQMRLLESRSLGYTLNPRLQFDWRIEDHFAAEGFPHRSCVSRAAVPDVTGLTRSEMMIVTGMMIAAMREKGNQRALVVPVCYYPLSTSFIISKTNGRRL